MPLLPSLGPEDKVPHAFAKFNTGIERPIIDMHQILMRSDDSPFTIAQRELLAAFVYLTVAVVVQAVGLLLGARVDALVVVVADPIRS